MSDRSSRFRVGHVAAPSTLSEQIRDLIASKSANEVGPGSLGEQLMELCSRDLPQLVNDSNIDEILHVLAAMRESRQQHRAYFVHKLAAMLLIQRVERIPTEDVEIWAPLIDAIPAALVSYLEAYPAEPALLNFAGYAYYELGITTIAKRLFECVLTLEPEHIQARKNLAACKQRSAGGRSNIDINDGLRLMSETARPAFKRIVEAALRAQAIRPTIALCMIVKNEEEMLPGCLAAVSQYVDEMIIVDTGSTDRTREIAAQFGATVREFEWTGSFSDARNFSVEGVETDWILYLDADEHLVDDDGKHFHDLARKRWVEGFYLHETNHTGEFEMGTQVTHMALRLYQNRPEYRWKGIVHEQKLWAFPTYLSERFQNSPVRINHYGYLQSVIQDRDKTQRNLELLLQQAQEGDNAFTEFNIGSEYAAINDWKNAREHFEKSLDLAKQDAGWQSAQFAPMLIARLVTARRGVGATQASLELIDEALAWWPDFTDLVFERALALIEQAQLDEALEELDRALVLGDAPAHYVAVQGKGSFQARVLKATILRKRGDRSGARNELEAALQSAPHYVPTVLELADVLLETEDPDSVVARLDQFVDAKSTTANLLLGASFFERGAFNHARRYYDRVLNTSGELSIGLVAMAELQLSERDFAGALASVQGVDSLDVIASQAAATEFLAAVLLGDLSALSRPYSTITMAQYLPHGQRAFYTAWHARLTGGNAILTPDAITADHILLNLEALAKLEATEEFEKLLPLLETAIPDERQRRLRLGNLYLRRHFMDMAAEEYMACANAFGPDPETLTGLGKVATMKELWDDAKVFLNESLKLDPAQPDAQKLLHLIEGR